jgi:hypothetical protein
VPQHAVVDLVAEGGAVLAQVLADVVRQVDHLRAVFTRVFERPTRKTHA